MLQVQNNLYFFYLYSSPDKIERMLSTMKSSNIEEVYNEWRQIANLFSYENKAKEKKSKLIKDLISEIIDSKEGKGKITIIDLSETSAPENTYWNDEMKYITIAQVLYELTSEAEEKYRRNKGPMNTLVILDEAHRLVPKGIQNTNGSSKRSNIIEEVKSILVDAARTTRKYGLGWMFISQSLSSLDREKINQMRIYVFGFGLAWGIERQALREIIGGAEAMRLYQLFRDPLSTLAEREYPFMSIGPISPLSVSDLPIFFTSLKYPDEFLKANFSK
jgi:hypothetical protein